MPSCLRSAGANPERVLNQIRNKLRIKAAMVNIQMGEESNFNGSVSERYRPPSWVPLTTLSSASAA